MLRTILNKRKQLPDESISSYINEAEALCKKIDPKMSQTELVHTIMKGLQPRIARYVGILDNNTLTELKRNIRKYESIEFMIDGSKTEFQDEIKHNIARENIFNINNSDNQNRIDVLASQISRIEDMLSKCTIFGNQSTQQNSKNENFKTNYINRKGLNNNNSNDYRERNYNYYRNNNYDNNRIHNNNPNTRNNSYRNNGLYNNKPYKRTIDIITDRIITTKIINKILIIPKPHVFIAIETITNQMIVSGN
ncbi:uncharacterized protein DDB_G0289917-like [Daktulosphaira vitifoliae]|uniref:uncharacterized protein DDB_G0289917-like n=1 Tax=Daktulosphaira vitifoliae TaxID=58002 RepID=UPI0021AA79E9|nr:uncharacterized protein DDB_G0289917-like [Daktulosphaira vitifoliae]